MSDVTGENPPKTARVLPIVAILLVALAGAFTLRDVLTFDALRENREALLAFRDQNMGGMAALFVLAYVGIVAFSLPGAAVASVTGGFLFGLAGGTVLNVGSATVGACLIFLAARWGLGTWLTERIEASEGRVQAMKQALRENEIEVLFLMRLIPAVPFFAANLLPALVGVKFRNFVVTTALGIIPGGIVFTWIGVGLGEVLDRWEDPDLSLLWEPHVIGPVIGLCLLAAMPILIKSLRARKKA